MPESLDIPQLRTLVAVAECGGVGRAAAVMHISQPTVSQHIRSLERKVHRELLERVGRKVRLTPDGERLLVQARRILEVHDRALESLDAVDDPPLVVGLSDTVAEALLPAVDGPWRAAFAGRRLRYVIDRSSVLADAVARGIVDTAVILGIGGQASGRQVDVLPLDWYSSSDLFLDPSDAVPLIAYAEPCGIRQRALQQLGAYSREAEVVADAAGIDGIVAAARAGIGVAALPTLRLGGRAAYDGLLARHDLPMLGAINVRLVTRRGADAEIEDRALGALESAFAPAAEHIVRPA
ncbi:LysR family transcriptional regulator [Agromyces albus]|uniref:LysR family transcriptional regulator n=1 Tax=Agromyces albus TaxID=205332 RepID=UPI002782BB52|nr:LysR family transcriptional regulator [Agromyces albus]MDQ0574221.1 DNA-binding transcriptional LysR family regulator [Agromyces albus]